MKTHTLDKLPSQLHEFAKLPTGTVYSLADRQTVQLGAAAFVTKNVTNLAWLPAKSADSQEEACVVATVKDTWKNARTMVYPPQGERLLFLCSCGKQHPHQACVHVISVLAALFAITQDRSLTMYPLNPVYVQDLLMKFRESLGEEVVPAEAEEEELPVGDREIRVYHEKGRGLLLESSGAVHPPILLKLGFPLNFHNITKRTRAKVLNYRQPGMDLVRFVEDAAEYDLPVVHYTEDERKIVVTGEYAETRSSSVLNLQSRDGVVTSRSVPLRENGEPVDVVLQLSDHAVLDGSGRLYFLEKSASEFYLDLANPRTSYWSNNHFAGVHFRLQRGPMTDRLYNDRALAYPPPDFPDTVEDLELRVDDVRVAMPETAEPAECGILLTIRQDEEGKGLVCRTAVTLDERPVPSDATAGRLAHELVAWDIDDKLLNAKSRAKILLDAALQLPLVKSTKERNELISGAVDQPVFKRLRLQGKARNWLARFERNWLEERSASRRPLALLAFPDAAESWRIAASPGPRLARIWLGMLQPSGPGDFEGIQEEFRIPLRNQTTVGVLKLASLICASVGARLEYRGKPVQREKVDVIIHASESQKIDWFELSPEVRCGSLAIPQEEWEALMRGDLLLEEDGKYLLPEVTQQEAVARLQEIFGKPRRKRGGKSAEDRVMEQVPRLQMLDWMLLRSSGITVNLPGEAEALFQSLLNLQEIPHKSIPGTLNATMREYQHRGFDWLAFLYEHRFGACLADDMGLGKTLQAIALLAWHRETQVVNKRNPRLPHLVVVPPSLVFNWQSEVARFCPDLTTSEYTGNERNLPEALKADLVITTYDIVRRDIGKMQDLKFDIVIFDETQTLKNLTAGRTKAALLLQRRFTACLTGTPMENHAGEYYSIMNLALPGIFGDYKTFRQSLRDEEGEHLLRRARPFVLRRTKGLILKELPPKVENDLHLDMTEEQKEIYTRTVGEVREEVLEAYRDKTKSQAGIMALSAITRLRQVCVSPELLGKPIQGLAPKVEYLLDQLEELHDEGHSVLVFSQFTRALDLMELHIKTRELPYLRLDGKTPQKKRKTLVEKFQNDPEPHTFLVSLKAGGVGLNLTRANYVYHVDPWWNPAVENQASDRVHRIGQHQTVFIQRLLMRHTIEEKMMALKERKQQLFDAIIEAPQGETGASLNISRDDFEYLLGG